MEDVRVDLVDELGDRIGRQRTSDRVLHLGQPGMVAVGRARRCVDEALHSGIARGDEHVEEARGVRGVRPQRVFQRPRNRSECRLVQHDVHTCARPMARGRVHDIGLEPRMPSPRIGTDRVADSVEIVPVTGCKIVEAHDLLAQAEQRLEQMRSDESRAACHQPAQRLFAQPGARCRIRDGTALGPGHQSLHTWMPCARKAVMSAWLFTST